MTADLYYICFFGQEAMASILSRARKTDGLLITSRSSQKRDFAILPAARGKNKKETKELPRLNCHKRLQDSLSASDDDVAISRKRAKLTLTSRPRARNYGVSPNSAIISKPRCSPQPQPTMPVESQELKSRPSGHLSPNSNCKWQAPQQPQNNSIDGQVNGVKRKLRSQESSRFKSQLSTYFPEYDEVVGNKPKENHILNSETPIIVIDTAKKSSPYASPKIPINLPLAEFADINLSSSGETAWYDDITLPNLREIEEVACSLDPLCDEYFELMHKKPARAERALRKTEKERAQHERDQVIRLLQGLQGHDWLKLMGISGVTESKKRDYEPAREYFTHGCESIIAKFKLWRDEEKRKKLAKITAGPCEATVCSKQSSSVPLASATSGNSYYTENDSETLPSQQLHHKATVASSALSLSTTKYQPQTDWPCTRPQPESQTAASSSSEFFFARFNDADANSQKEQCKKIPSCPCVYVWGHPLFELPEREFNLPEELLDQDSLRTHARKKRRAQRLLRKNSGQT
ncbi:BgTH12-01650 [Blumeria graminis f. sp. triticale]|uniref:BgTH12-01650 n=1 Tax=Blumeria graminis f. sp. triticale TaxID=1689686 RepID=A0A9W4GE98_BLUGR|nr:BgTH12-01650 [Blumeria graminis f. sp. triticale]